MTASLTESAHYTSGARGHDKTTAAAMAAAGRRAQISGMAMNIVILQPLVALIAGILILVIPRLLNLIVAIYLIWVGISGLWPHFVR
jgi:hypothetical protein